MAEFTVETIEAQHAAVFRAEAPMRDLPDVFARGFQATARVAAQQGVQVVGPAFGFYPRMPSDTVEVMVGFPVATPVAAEGDVTAFELPGGRVVTGLHVGSYDDLADAHGELAEWAASEGLELGEQMWESYLTDPEEEPDPTTWQTLVRRSLV